MDISRREVYNFPPYHFYPKSGELHGRGMVVRCPAQAAVVLDTLLNHAGQVVTRDELRTALWPDGDSLAYDDAINKTISYLRQVLRDSSRSPNYIETLPKRGYRFVATVEFQQEIEEPLSPPVQVHELPAEPADSAPPSLVAAEHAAPRGTRYRGALLVLCVLLLVAAGLAAWRYTAARHAAAARQQQANILRVGIAPFEASGADSQALAESFRLDITDALAQVPQLRVSASHVTPSDAEGRGAMLLLHADVLIFGTFALDQDHVRLQLELAHGNDASHMATFRYDVTRKNLIGLRERVQADLLLALNASRAREGAALGSTGNAEAYDVYQRARAHLQQWDLGRWTQAEKEFHEAIRRDPGFARAYSGLATTLIAEAEHGVLPQQQGYEQARQYASRALQLDPQLAEGHAVLGNIAYQHDWDFARAEQEYRTAIALDPGHSHYHVWLAGLLCALGRFHQSIDEVNLAHELDPSWKSPYLAATAIYSSAGQDGRSLEVARQLVAMDPNAAIAHHQLGWNYWYSGSYAEAVAEWRTMAVLQGNKDRQALEEEGARVLQREGVKGYAELRLKAIESGKKWQAASLDFVPSEWFLYAGQPDNAIAALSSQIDRHEAAALQIGVDPAYSTLRQDPRYQMLLRRMHFSIPVLLGHDDWRSVWE